MLGFKKVEGETEGSPRYYAKTIGTVYTSYYMPQIDTDDIVAMEDTHITVRGYRRRTTIPSGIFRFMELEDGDVIRWIATKDGVVYVSKLEK
jgi:hypothetical protein